MIFKGGRGGLFKLEVSFIWLIMKSKLYNLIKIVHTCLNRYKKKYGKNKVKLLIVRWGWHGLQQTFTMYVMLFLHHLTFITTVLVIFVIRKSW